MKNIINFLLIPMLVSVISGCSLLDWAVTGDAASTYAAISSGVGVEGNPVLTKLAGNGAAPVAAASAVLTYGVAHGFKRYAPEDCQPMVRAITASKLGATANNVAILAGASGNVPILLGLAAGYAVYRMEANQKSAAEFCSA